jgi:hypothetical protein
MVLVGVGVSATFAVGATVSDAACQRSIGAFAAHMCALIGGVSARIAGSRCSGIYRGRLTSKGKHL